MQAGASLESLAKGAVKFSRRFTVHELQERWYALLYDPVVSSEASIRMAESERSTSAHPSKVNKTGASKENKATGKRKAETVSSCYYALRKRISNEHFGNMDLSFLVAPGNSAYVGDVDGPLSANGDHGHPIPNPFADEVPEMDNVANAFPDDLMDTRAFPTELQNLAVENFQIDQNGMDQDFSHILGEDTGNIPEGGVVGDPKDLPDDLFFKAGDQVSGDQSNMCLDFEEDKIFDSPVSGCVAPFSNMEFSPLPEMPIWKTVSAPDLHVDMGLGDKDLLPGDAFRLPDDYDGMNAETSGYDGHQGVKVKTETGFDDFEARNSSEGYLAEISNSLLNFTNEEELFMNGAGKDIIDKSYYDGLSSLLLNSPNDISQEHVASMTETEEPTGAPDVCPASSLSPPHESNKVSDEQMCLDSQPQIQLPVSVSVTEFPELENGVICCVLNTEDPDIPCNDIPLQMLLRARTSGASIPSSAKDMAGNQRISDIPNQVRKEQHVTGEYRVSSQRIGSHAVQGTGQSPVVNNSVVSKPGSNVVASRVSGVPCVVSEQISSKPGTEGIVSEHQNEKVQETLNSKDCSMKKSVVASSGISYPNTNSICVIKEENGVDGAIGDQERLELTSMNIAVSEPVPNSPIVGEDGLVPSGSNEDDDIPYYSDVEAMVDPPNTKILQFTFVV